MAREILDVTILVLATLRLTRFVTTDDLGYWLLCEPLYRWAGYDPDGAEPQASLKQRLVSGLACPHCVGFWLGVALLALLGLTGGPGSSLSSHLVWEWGAGAFALSYVTGHVSARLDGGEWPHDDHG